jgi:hypothetical protein
MAVVAIFSGSMLAKHTDALSAPAEKSFTLINVPQDGIPSPWAYAETNLAQISGSGAGSAAAWIYIHCEQVGHVRECGISEVPFEPNKSARWFANSVYVTFMLSVYRRQAYATVKLIAWR